jgi:hypothetical protein
VGAEFAGEQRDVVVVGGDEAAVAEAAEVLGGEEGVGAGVSEGAGLLALVAGAEGLGAVFDDLEVVASAMSRMASISAGRP